MKRPKLLKDFYAHAEWPWIFEHHEGMSFNPIRPQGCLQYIGLGILAFLVMVAIAWIAQITYDVAASVVTFLAGMNAPIAILFGLGAGAVLCLLALLYEAFDDD